MRKPRTGSVIPRLADFLSSQFLTHANRLDQVARKRYLRGISFALGFLFLVSVFCGILGLAYIGHVLSSPYPVRFPDDLIIFAGPCIFGLYAYLTFTAWHSISRDSKR